MFDTAIVEPPYYPSLREHLIGTLGEFFGVTLKFDVPELAPKPESTEGHRWTA